MNNWRRWRARLLPGFVGACLAVLLVSVAHADFSPEEWRYSKNIETPGLSGPEELLELRLDREVFQESADLRDLRVVIPEGPTEVAYQLVSRAGERQRLSVPARMRDLAHVPGQHSSFVLDLGEPGNLHNEVQISTASPNFQREVAIEASADGEAWAVLIEGVSIFAFTFEERGFTAKETRVSYPESSLRYLRVKIINGGEDPIEVDGATISSVTETLAEETSYPSMIVERSEDAEARTSTVELDLGSQGLPLHRLVVRTSAVNFYREVALEGGNDRETWFPVIDGSGVYSYRTSKFTGDGLEVRFPERSYRYYRLAFQNLDDQPVPVEGVTFSGFTRALLFLAQPDTSYALYYGNEAARTPGYDLERLLPYLDTMNPAEARLGPQTSNPDYEVDREPASEQYPWLITVAVVAAAVVVAAILFGIFRQARRVLPPPPDSAE